MVLRLDGGAVEAVVVVDGEGKIEVVVVMDGEEEVEVVDDDDVVDVVV